MGTRSITEIRSAWGDEPEFRTVAVIYRHWDGYLCEHGRYLCDFLDGLHIVNGIGRDMPKRYANGPGRLAAQLITKMQLEGHSPDLHADTGPCGQEYHYRVDVRYGPDGGTVCVTVFDGPMTAFGMGGEGCTNEIFTGTVREFDRWLRDQENGD